MPANVGHLSSLGGYEDSASFVVHKRSAASAPADAGGNNRPQGHLVNIDQVRYSGIVVQRMNIYEAKSQLSALLKRVEAGEEFVIARAGVPVARLVPYQRPIEHRRPGLWRGRVEMAPDFDATPTGFAEAFDGAGSLDATSP